MLQVIPQPFLPVILGLIAYKFRGPERLPVLCGDTPTMSHFHNTSHIQPFIWTADHFLCTSVWRVPYWTQRATHLKQRSHECSPKKGLICSIPYLVHEVLWIGSGVDLWTRS